MKWLLIIGGLAVTAGFVYYFSMPNIKLTDAEKDALRRQRAGTASEAQNKLAASIIARGRG